MSALRRDVSALRTRQLDERRVGAERAKQRFKVGPALELIESRGRDLRGGGAYLTLCTRERMVCTREPHMPTGTVVEGTGEGGTHSHNIENTVGNTLNLETADLGALHHAILDRVELTVVVLASLRTGSCATFICLCARYCTPCVDRFYACGTSAWKSAELAFSTPW